MKAANDTAIAETPFDRTMADARAWLFKCLRYTNTGAFPLLRHVPEIIEGGLKDAYPLKRPGWIMALGCCETLLLPAMTQALRQTMFDGSRKMAAAAIKADGLGHATEALVNNLAAQDIIMDAGLLQFGVILPLAVDDGIICALHQGFQESPSGVELTRATGLLKDYLRRPEQLVLSQTRRMAIGHIARTGQWRLQASQPARPLATVSRITDAPRQG